MDGWAENAAVGEATNIKLRSLFKGMTAIPSHKGKNTCWQNSSDLGWADRRSCCW